MAGELIRVGRVRVGRLYHAVLLLCLLGIAAIAGTRDFSTGADTRSYLAFYQMLRGCKCLLNWHEPGFEIVSLPAALLGADQTAYLVWIAGVGVMLLWHLTTVTVNSVPEERSRYKLRALIVCLFLLSPLYASAQLNAIRQGLASLALLILAVHLGDRRWLHAAGWSVISVSLHYSSVLYLLSLVLLAAPPLMLYAVSIASLAFYVTGSAEAVVAWVSDITGVPLYPFVASYGSMSTYEAGVRLDFVAASVVFLAIGMVLTKTASASVRPRMQLFSKVYLCFMLPFLWLGWGAFSNRYAYPAWFMMSIIVGVGGFRYVRRLPRPAFLATVMGAVIFFAARVF